MIDVYATPLAAISANTIGAATIAANDFTKRADLYVCNIRGRIDSKEEVKTTFGKMNRYSGIFVASDPNTGEVFKSRQCFVPGKFDADYNAMLTKELKGGVEIDVEVHALVSSKNPYGFAWVIIPVNAEADKELEALLNVYHPPRLGTMPNPNQLALPDVDTTTTITTYHDWTAKSVFILGSNVLNFSVDHYRKLEGEARADFMHFLEVLLVDVEHSKRLPLVLDGFDTGLFASILATAKEVDTNILADIEGLHMEE